MKCRLSVWWLSYLVGLGVSYTNTGGSGPDRSAAIDLAAAYRVDRTIAFGLHLRGSHVEGSYFDQQGTTSVETEWSVYNGDVAAAAHVGGRRVMFSPWLGVHVRHGASRTYYIGFTPNPPDEHREIGLKPELVFGALLAVDLWRSGPLESDPHRVSLYMQVQLQGNHGSTLDSDALTLGMAYRR